MCKYCNNSDDFESNDEYLVEGKVPLVLDSELDMYVYLDSDNKLSMVVGVLIGGTGGDYKAFKKKIKYCPMCGRKLVEQK